MTKKDDAKPSEPVKSKKVAKKTKLPEIEASAAEAPQVPLPESAELAKSTDPASAPAPATFAKSGKKSKKTTEAAAAEAARQARKAATAEEPQVSRKTLHPTPRPRLARRGKKYQSSYAKIDHTKLYPLEDALKLAITTATTTFDSSVEAHVRLGVDPRQADQNIRATVTLPSGTGKTIRVAVFAPADQLKLATSAGADLTGDEDFLKLLDKEKLDFDILISTPAYMPKLGKYARLLGPKGLMPNPKAGTITTDITKAVTDAKTGKVEYRVDKQSIVHIGLGKVSFGAPKLIANTTAFLDSLKAQKPSTLKGQYIKSIYLTTTMGPSIHVENLYN